MMLSKQQPSTTESQETDFREELINAFDRPPQDYVAGSLPRLSVFSNREWWLNVDYVVSESEPDDEVIRLMIRASRKNRPI